MPRVQAHRDERGHAVWPLLNEADAVPRGGYRGVTMRQLRAIDADGALDSTTRLGVRAPAADSLVVGRAPVLRDHRARPRHHGRASTQPG